MTVKDLGTNSRYPSLSALWKSAQMQSSADLPSSVECPLKAHTFHYLCHSPHLSEFLALPHLDGEHVNTAHIYLAGVGDNSKGKSLAEVVNHTLKDVLSYMPQCLALGGALMLCSQNEERSDSQLEPSQHCKLVNEIADGTVRPWTYSGTFLTLFTLHSCN